MLDHGECNVNLIGGKGGQLKREDTSGVGIMGGVQR